MEFLEPLQILWDYLGMHQTPTKADCIVGFGNFNTDIARRAAQLYLQGYAPKILFTGGLGRNTDGLFAEPEAVKFARVAMEDGVPEEAIILEDRSTNTKENILFTRELLRRVTEEARAFGCGAVQITASDMGVLLYTDFGFQKNPNFMQLSFREETP